jgi:hypothetical protein
MAARSAKTDAPAQRAIGDAATAAGMAVVAATAPVTGGDDEINKTRDYIAERAKRTGPDIDIWVQPTAPAHKAGRIWIKT